MPVAAAELVRFCFRQFDPIGPRHGVPAEIDSDAARRGDRSGNAGRGRSFSTPPNASAGITIHQLAGPGSPIVWGGAPAIFDMSTGNTPMGAIETAMLNLGCAQVGKFLGLPTHGYWSPAMAAAIDAQAGAESGVPPCSGALAGINMISGAGMIDFLACHSIEKLVIDAEAIASAQRLIAGVQARTGSLALESFDRAGRAGNFLN